jgi:tetratricopeptide (TPR) repeat protein
MHEVAYSLGLLLAEEKRYEEAAVCLEKAAQGIPQRARIHYNLGLLLQLLGRDSEAEKELLAALRIEPDNIDFLYAAADHFLKRGRLGEAKRMAETMIERYPSNRLGHDLLGFINSRMQECIPGKE